MRLDDGAYVVLSDLQCPYEDRKTVRAVQDFVRAYKPSGLLCVGDESDSPEPSRWSRGSAAEYTGQLEAGLQRTYDVMKGFSDALNTPRKLGQATPAIKPFHVMRSNHCDRINNYLARYAPAMHLTSWNSYTRIVGYGVPPLLEGRTEALPVTWHDEPWEFARGWVMAHGDEGGASRIPGGTAMGLARKWGVSTVVGHTHKAGIQHEHKTLNGKVTQELYGMEVGHMMSLKDAGYLKAGSANWQQAIAILHIRRGRVYPQLVNINKGKFIVDGVLYE